MVHFVGAGCGAPDLITVRGAKLLSQADVVIYAGSLVNPELLESTKPGCEKHDSAGMTLEQIVEIIRTAETEGKTTVRLHSGDPSIYGAVREQFDALEKIGIAYDVCPGVSALSGAAAALKTEYTVPEISQTLILSRMEGRTPVPAKERIRFLASHRASMALFLSAGLLEGLQNELLAGGYEKDTPAAIVYKASWPDERIVRCRLDELKEAGEKNHIRSTALVLVGRFLGDAKARSRLYDPSFATGFREAEP